MALQSKLKVCLKDNPPALKCFSMKQLEMLSDSFCVCSPPGTKLVAYGVNPPADTSIAWQPTLEDGVTPKGMVMSYAGGAWRVQ